MGARSRFSGLLAALALSAGFAAPVAPASAALVTTLAVSAAPGDLTLLAIEFPRSHGRAPGALSLHVGVRGAFGSDFLGLAVPRGHGGQPALLLLGNRPSALEDPATVHLRLISSDGLGAPLVLRRVDPLTKDSSHRAPAGLCVLTGSGQPLAASSLRALSAHGTSLRGLSTAGAVAAAYDAACGLSYGSVLKAALAGSEERSGGGSGGGETPTPPTPGPPRCAPCEPSRGVACPLVARAAYCVAGRVERAASSAAR